jgi:hypothetical protein
MMTALALLCAATVAAPDCDRGNAVRWWLGDPCNLPSACLILAEERASKTEVVPRNGEYWKFTSQR